MLDDISGDDIAEAVENTADQNDRTDGGGVDADDIGVENTRNEQKMVYIGLQAISVMP